MREPNLAIEIDENQQPILVVQCPECGFQSRFTLEDISPETSVLCNCGGVLNISENELQAVRQKLADFKKP